MRFVFQECVYSLSVFCFFLNVDHHHLEPLHQALIWRVKRARRCVNQPRWQRLYLCNNSVTSGGFFGVNLNQNLNFFFYYLKKNKNLLLKVINMKWYVFSKLLSNVWFWYSVMIGGCCHEEISNLRWNIFPFLLYHQHYLSFSFSVLILVLLENVRFEKSLGQSQVYCNPGIWRCTAQNTNLYPVSLFFFFFF